MADFIAQFGGIGLAFLGAALAVSSPSLPV